MRGKTCAVHRHESLAPQENHHIWPKEFHGPSIPSNMIMLCANGHGDVHYLLSAMLKGKPVDRREYGPATREIADRGYAAVMEYAASLVPQPKP